MLTVAVTPGDTRGGTRHASAAAGRGLGVEDYDGVMRSGALQSAGLAKKALGLGI
jgi:hypothetical protein